MTDVDVIVSIDNGASRAKLSNGWVYWKEAGAFQVLRADAQGLLFKFTSGERTRQDGYKTPFTSQVGNRAEVYYSQGARPLPEAVVTPALCAVTVPLSLSASLAALGPVHVTPGQPNAIRRMPLAEIRIPDSRISLTAPADEPCLLFALLEKLDDPDDPYYTNGIQQGASWFTQRALQESGAPPAVAASVSQRPRGIRIAGAVPKAATKAILKILDAAGAAVSVLKDGSNLAGGTQQELELLLGKESGDVKEFTGTLFFPENTSFGPMLFVIEPKGLTPPHVAGFAFHVAGAQTSLVDDFEANPNAQQPGPSKNVRDEVLVLDYTNSPSSQPGTTRADAAAARAAQRALGRVRRMVRYGIRNHNIKTVTFPATATPVLPAGQGQFAATEMPCWMAGLELVGLDRAGLEDLMIRRATRPKDATVEWKLDLDWQLDVTWETPDRAATNPTVQSPHRVSASQTVTVTLDAEPDVFKRRIANINQGVIQNAVTPAPAVIPFPVANRRLPVVRIADAGADNPRSWGRTGAPPLPALSIEWQPILSVDGATGSAPIIRGGDGLLSLRALKVDGKAADPGLVFPRVPPAGATPTPAPPPAAPLILLPRFRVHGINLTPAQLADMVDVITEETFRRNVATSAFLNLLPLAIWKETARRIARHETGSRQYATPGGAFSGVITIALGGTSFAHGKELDMPVFGAPHGYGIGQLDPPGNMDRCWDVEQNAREAVRRLMIAAGAAANGRFNFASATATTRERNIFHRDTVRRYNGGREFAPNATNTDFVIRPSVMTNPFYPDDVLGTRVPYEQLLKAPNPREAGVNRAAPLATELAYTAAHFFPGIP
ncbi:MAG: hypothetical protein M3020_08870 [Myxococcota bacterium]|nr:hypothetical protein [Myxococcota bacterium]